MQKSKKLDIVLMLIFVVSIAFLIGTMTFLHTCGKTEDGSWMTCHWAGEMIKALAVVITMLSLISIILKEPSTRLGINLGIMAISIVTTITPGILIATCMMPEMRCNAITRPGTMLFGIVIAVLALVGCLFAHEDK